MLFIDRSAFQLPESAPLGEGFLILQLTQGDFDLGHTQNACTPPPLPNSKVHKALSRQWENGDKQC